MFPQSEKTDRYLIIENFRKDLPEDYEGSPRFIFTIDPTGNISHISESARGFFREKLKIELEKGDSCFELVPTNHLRKFTAELSRINTSYVPGIFHLPYGDVSFEFYMSPVFTSRGCMDNIQVLISEVKNLKLPQTTSFIISSESEQQFINKLIKSLGKANDIKLGLSRVIRHISKFLNFDFSEAWQVGYDKNTLFKSASYSKVDLTFDDEEFTMFKKGEGLPGMTWQAGKVEVWERISRDSRFLRKTPVFKNNISTGIGVPVIHEDEVIAVLTFFNNNGEESARLKGILERISFQVSSYVKRKITENRLNNMFRFSPDLIAVVGLDGYLKKVNPTFIKTFGFSEEKLLNTPFNQFLHKDDKLPTYERLGEVASGLRPRSFQNRCMSITGEYKWISWTPSELMEEEGVVHVFGTDISYIKETNLELLKFRNIIESSKDGIGLFTLETGDIFFNPAFCDLLGYTQEELKSLETIKKIYCDNNMAFEIFQTLLKGDYWEGDLQVMDNKGILFDYHFSGGPIINENEEIIAVFGLHTDISERKKYESSLKDHGDRINDILESITDGFFSLNDMGEVTYWNKAAEEILKVPRDIILGQELWDFFPAYREPVFYQKYLKAKSSNKKVSFEHFVQYLNTWVEVNVYPGKNGLSSYFKDISDRKRVEEERRIAQERYEVVSKATREAVYDWDIFNNTLDWSDSYYEIYGFDRIPAGDNLVQWKQQIHREDLQRVSESMNAAINSQESEWICEYKLNKADRNIAVVLERGYIIRDETGKAIRMIGSLQDITSLKQNERALEEMNYKLKKHSAELSRSNAELEQFAYVASHDLQEPLRMVTSFLTLLEKRYHDNLDEKARQYIHFATDGANRMKQIILDLLEYSRVGKLNYNFELIDLNLMMRNVIQLNENLIRDNNAQIEFKDLPVIKVASTPLERVLSNLLNNSIKYSRENVPPKITILVKDIGSHWEFMVKDNGIGIEEQFKEKIFIIFQRLHSRDQYSGTGIGLAICKKIVENHGGKIWVVSREDVGCTFHFTIQKQI